MPLNWDTSKCPFGPLTPDTPDDEWQWLESIIHYHMFTGTNTYLTDAETAEFTSRVRLWEKVGWGITTIQPLPAAMINRWRGVTCNVSPETRAAFNRRFIKRLTEELARTVKRELEEAHVA